MITQEELLARLERSAPWSKIDAERALAATLTAVGRRVPRHLAETLTHELPNELEGCLQAGGASSAVAPSAEAIVDEVARTVQLERPRALEQVELVWGQLFALCSEETRERLLRELPDTAAFLPPAPPQAPLRVGSGHTLADGRPGSAAPLSESAPGARRSLSQARAGNTQTSSVGEPNPHGDSKLSSARGLTQEREHESLAEGRTKAKP